MGFGDGLEGCGHGVVTFDVHLDGGDCALGVWDFGLQAFDRCITFGHAATAEQDSVGFGCLEEGFDCFVPEAGVGPGYEEDGAVVGHCNGLTAYRSFVLDRTSF